MLLAGLLGIPLEGQMHWWSAEPHACPVEEERGQLLDTFYPLLLTMFKLFLILVTAGFSPSVFAVGRCLRRCCFPPLHFSMGDSGRALLSLAPHHLPRHHLPNPEATESVRSIKLEFSATSQIQGWFEICECTRDQGPCVICLLCILF